ncbi:MAG: NADH-quinone oxidoreductase subunit N [Dehalococcoidia bacterium]
MSTWDSIHLIGPALTLYIGAGVVLLADTVNRGAPARQITLLAIGIAALYAVWHAMTGSDSTAFSGVVIMDKFALFFAFLLVTVAAAVVIAAGEWAARLEQAGEFYALLLTSTASMVLLAQGYDLILIFVALETTSVAQFILAGIGRDGRSSEAGLKYLLTGAVSAAVLLYGFAFLFGLSGTTSLEGIGAYVQSGPEDARLALLLAFVLMAAGFGFKMAIVPFHAWVPDVYQGAPTVVTSFLSVASKAAGFAIVLRVFYVGLGGSDTFISQDWAVLFGVFAAVSMTFGNVAAILQTDVKRLLGYSSIAQAGNIAVGLAAVAAGSTTGPSGVLFFLGTYAATNLGAFIAIIAISQRIGSDDIKDYAGLMRRSPWLAGILTLCLLSLTGIPPTAGFLAKIYIFNSAIQTGENWLVAVVVVAVFNTAISAYYYLRWARTMVMDEPADASGVRVTAPIQGLLALAAVGVLFFGLVPTPLIDAAQRAAGALQ